MAKIVFIRYIMLELARRTSNGPRTLGTLFHAGCDELRQVSFTEALRLRLNHLEQEMKALAEITTAPNPPPAVLIVGPEPTLA